MTVSVRDTLTGGSAQQNYTINIAASLPVVSGPSNLGNVIVGGAISGSFTVTGGKAPFRWSLSGAPGLTIDGSGNVTGTANSAGSFTASVSVTDALNASAGISASLTVLGIVTGSLPPAQTIADYSASVTAVGGLPPYSFTITGLPAGLNASGGAITGRPQVVGTSTVQAKVSDSKGLTVSATYSLAVTGSGVLRISSSSAGDGTVGEPYSQGLSASGGTPPYTWAQTGGVMPNGLNLGAGGTVSGTPTTPGGGSFGVQVTDASGGQVSGTISISIQALPLQITNGPNLPPGMTGVDYPAQTLTATGGTPPYTFSLKGSLPDGLALAGGQIAGTPNASGSFSFNVTVTDSAAVTASAGFALSVRPSAADLALSSSSAAFALTNGTSAVPGASTVSIMSTVPTQKLSFSTTVTPSVSWLSVTGGNSTPGSLSIALTSDALTLTAAGSPYSAVVAVACTSGICAGSSQSIAVTLTVSSAPPQLSVGSSLLSFTASTGNPQAASSQLEIRNTGGGALSGTSASSDASWLAVGAVPSSITPGPATQLSVTADPTGLKAGYYRGTVSVSSPAGKATVPVALLLSGDSQMTLGPAGTLFTAPEGGPLGKLSGSFLVSVNSSTGVGFSSSVLAGASWLVVGGGAGSASSASPGTISFSINSTEVAALKAGAYYGTIRVSASGIVNSPQDYQVVLNIVPGNRPAQPDPPPAGLLFLTMVGASAPPPQVVTLYASSKTPVTLQSATDGSGWLASSPGSGSTSASTAGQLTVSVDPTGLKAGVYRGGVNVSYSGTAVRTVNVTLVVQAAVSASLGAAGEISRLQPHATGPTCSGAQLVPTQTGLVNSFAAPASWPTPLAIRLVDTCGSVIGNGQIVATFSNGDPPLGLTLVDGKSGLYSATWTPRKSSQQVTINARATATGYTATTTELAGQVTPNEAPVLEPNGAQDVFNPQVGGGLGPGNIVQIYGSRLASQPISSTTLPLPTTVFGTKVLIGGVAAPLFYVSPGQVNAQVPFELTPGKQYQVIVSANGALTTPQPIQLNFGTPATLQFTSGLVVAQHPDGSLILDTSPAKPGEFIVFYMSGLGATDIDVPSGAAAPSDPPARVKDTPVVTLNGSPVDVAFAGLTPGLVGLYQVNLQVPPGLADGAYKVVVSQGGTPGNTTTLTVRK